MPATRSKDTKKEAKAAPAVASKGKAKAPAVKEKKDSSKKRVRMTEPEEEEVHEPREEEKADAEDVEDPSSEEIDFLEGFEEGDESEEGEDSSDEEGEAEGEKIDLAQLPKVDAQDSVQKKLEAKAERKKNAKTGTIYLGRVPHGFHEEEMRSYFSQFGEVTRLRLSRNKKTGASKHCAFIEFAYASVAQIVQETMNNYLLAGHILVCKLVPDSEIHPQLWVGANRKFRVVPKGRLDRIRREAPKTDAQKEKLKERLLTKEAAKRAKLAELGIDYDFEGYAKKTIEAKPDAVVEEAKPKGKKGAKKATEVPAKKKARKST